MDESDWKVFYTDSLSPKSNIQQCRKAVLFLISSITQRF